MLNTRFDTLPRHTRGFSLIEMAVVLVILSVLLSGILLSLSATQESRDRANAEQEISEIIEALYGFAQANGRLPCPARTTSAGLEAPVGGTACAVRFGFVPSATLGLAGTVNAQGLLLDPWQSPYRYAVTDSDGDAFTTAGRMKLLTISALSPDFVICADAACGTVIANTVPAVVMSLGKNWATFPASNLDETENAEVTVNGYRQNGDVTFVSTNYSDEIFDDLITWISPNILYTRMISAGQLP